MKITAYMSMTGLDIITVLAIFHFIHSRCQMIWVMEILIFTGLLIVALFQEHTISLPTSLL